MRRLRARDLALRTTNEPARSSSNVTKRNLSGLVFGKDVEVEWTKVDGYGRLVGTVVVAAVNANLEQLKAGLAWYYREYEPDVTPENRPAYAKAEAAAKAARLGLWRDPAPVAPWAFRHPDTAAPPKLAPLPLVSRPSSATGDIIGNVKSHIYHLPICMDYDRVAERNRVYFKTEAEAQAAGFRVAKNCRQTN